MSSLRKLNRAEWLFGLTLALAVPASSNAQVFQRQAGVGADQLGNAAGRLINAGPAGNAMPAPSVLPPMPPYPYINPYFPSYYDPFGGYLRGGAEVINAQGQMMVNQQQAYMMKEQYRSAKIDRQRKAFDEYLYERERTPTAEEERQRFMQQQVSRARHNPPPTEIWSGKTLNDLLADLQKQLGQPGNSAQRAYSTPLDPEAMKHINVTTSRGGNDNLGLVKNGGKLFFPEGLSGPEFKEERDRVTAQMQEALKQAEFNGRVDVGTLKQLTSDVDRMNRQLRKMVGEQPPSVYIEAKTFLSNVDASIAALRQPDAGARVRGEYEIKARTVPELVKFMTDKGLQFAGAVPGDESAYLTLQRAMAAQDTALTASLQR